jgi:CRP-like cAMP-binding protein
VVVETPARLLGFERQALEAFLARNEDIRAALEQSVARDLRQKLAATSRSLARDAAGAARA